MMYKFLVLCYQLVFDVHALRSNSVFRLPYIGRRHVAANWNIREELETPAWDRTTEYFQFTLPNGISTMIVRDPSSEKSSASLAVKVGAQDDPSDRQGLAHFTEHAVFLGSQKFPEERFYKEYLTCSAFPPTIGTGMESTSYKFEINAGAFENALDIFSQFFKEPLFSSDAIAREVMAVDAEDSKNRIIDGRRIWQVIKNLIIPDHPYTKFSTGNVRTLAAGNAEQNAVDVSRAMRSFHSRHYRPDNIVLALVGPQKIDELKDFALSMFSNIMPSVPGSGQGVNYGTDIFPSNSLKRPSSSADCVYPFQKNGIVVKIKPVKDLRDISILWGLPPTRTLYRSNPCRLLSHILSHKGANSVFAVLQDKGWATSTSAKINTEYDDFSIYEMSVSLTTSGLENWDKVVEIVYAQLYNIESMSGEEAVKLWNEIKTNSAIDFRYKDKGTAYQLASHLAGNMLKYPPHHVISAGWLFDDLDIELFRDFVRQLQPNSAVTMIRSRSFSWIPDDSNEPLSYSGNSSPDGSCANRKEPWYGVPYHQQDTPHQYQRAWGDARKGINVSNSPKTLSIPSLNPYISYELENRELLVPSIKHRTLRSSYPVKVASSGEVGGQIWHSKDEVFGHPKSVFYSLLHTSEYADGHPVNALLTSVYNQVSSRSLYDAAVAGLEYSVSIGIRGVSITVYGYSPRLSSLAKKVFADFGDSSFWTAIDSNIVEVCKERMLRGLKSWLKERPDSQCDTLLSYLLQEHVWLPSDRIQAVEQITKESLVSRVQSLINYSRVTSFVHGDMSSSTASSLHKESMAAFHSKQVSTDANSDTNFIDVPSRPRILPPGHQIVALPCFNADDINSALVVHIQMAATSPLTTALLLFMRSLMGEPLFSELRTKKQLGYIVSLSTGGYGRAPGSLRGLTVRLLSNRFSPKHMQSELGMFFHSQESIFANLTDVDVSRRASSIIKDLLDPPTTYSEEGNNFWDSIVTGLPFDWTDQVVNELKALDASAVQRAAKKWLFDSGSRRSISFMLFGNGHLNELERLEEAATDVFFPPCLTTVTSVESLTILRDSLHLFDDSFPVD